MTLTLTYTAKTTLPVEIQGLTPDWACDKSIEQIERLEIFHGNQRLPLAEMFDIAGDPSDRHLLLQGNLSGVHRIGAQMVDGRIDVQGSAGRHLGSAMRGGEIHVEENVQGWAGAEMQGGMLHIHGNAGDLVGAAYRGSPRGMTGGTILIDGDAGNEVGLRMRRGLIAIGGSAGDMLGFHMLAGTMLVFGSCGLRPGANMRRGTLGLLGSRKTPLLPSFRHGCTIHPPMWPLLLRSLQAKRFAVDEQPMKASCELFHGDLVAGGKGEVFLLGEG